MVVVGIDSWLVESEMTSEAYLQPFFLSPLLAIDLYFKSDTPLLVGGEVSAEFEADRTGLVFYCHLTHLDDVNFREEC